ncbi:MAG: AAA family ATPase, partial [Deltaproteobacteria bacterium]
LFETDDGTVKVLDFGIAKVLPASPVLGGDGDATDVQKLANDTAPDGVARSWGADADPNTAATIVPGIDAMAATRQAEETPRVTSETRIGGTPLYMAPEVWRQEFADHASDVWSLGATLFTLATGQPPFVGRSIPEIAFRVLTNTASDPLATRRPDLPESVCAIVDRALSKARDRRFASASEVLASLDRAVREAERPRALEGSPYPGLRPMGSSDHDRFFGRDDDAARVVERLRGESLVVLVGPSGAGKSSLAAAGVAPAVARGALGEFAAWDVVRIAPGRTPLTTLAHAVAQLTGSDGDVLEREMRDAPDALARALRAFVQQRGRGVLVLLDQLEEMVTLADRTDRDLVSGALGRMVSLAPSGVRVLATARSDLFDRLATLGTLGAQLGRATELVRPLAGDALRQAIEEPARAAGARFEDPSVIDAIVQDVGTGEGALPLVAFAMRAWWDRRDRASQTLTLSAWREVGGVMGALGAHAELVFHALTVSDRTVARTVFQRVCAPDGTRRYSTRGELAATVGDVDGLKRVLDALVHGRLLLSEGDGDDAQVTLAHEALSRAWPRMTHWQQEGREDRALHERLRVAADVWTASGESREMLWRGALLAEVGRWRELYDDTLAPVERAFADASRRELRRGRWRARGMLAAGLLAVSSLGGFQWSAAGRARDAAVSRLRAIAQRDAARGAEDLAFAWRDEDPGIALAYLARAARSSGRATAAMRQEALAYESRGAARRFECSAPPAVRGDGARVACADAAGIRVIEVDTATQRRIESPAVVRDVALAERGEIVAWV